MARDYDTQLLESVTVRRRRLRDAFLYGQFRSRRTLDENLVKVLAGVCVAAVMCAGSAGWSFVQQQRAVQAKQQNQLGLTPSRPPASTPASPAAVSAESWGGRHVTLRMLAAALQHVGTPAGLYSLPGVHEASSDSHYFLTRRSGGWSAGVTERASGRTGPRFATEDAACRWLYNELVFAEPAQETLSARAARQRAEALTQRIDALLHPPTPSPKPTQKGKKPTKPTPPPTYVVITLVHGFVVDLYGQESASYVYPYGVAPQSGSHRFQVVKPLRVIASEAGGRVQLHVETSLLADRPDLATVRWLLHNGYLRRVTGG